MIELRWVREVPATKPDTLEYREFLQITSSSGVIGLQGGSWTEWKPVPVVLIKAVSDE